MGRRFGTRVGFAEVEERVGCAEAQCLRHDSVTHQFVVNWKLGKQPPGAVTISATVSYPGATVTTKLTENITIVKK